MIWYIVIILVISAIVLIVRYANKEEKSQQDYDVQARQWTSHRVTSVAQELKKKEPNAPPPQPIVDVDRTARSAGAGRTTPFPLAPKRRVPSNRRPAGAKPVEETPKRRDDDFFTPIVPLIVSDSPSAIESPKSHDTDFGGGSSGGAGSSGSWEPPSHSSSSSSDSSSHSSCSSHSSSSSHSSCSSHSSSCSSSSSSSCSSSSSSCSSSSCSSN